MADGSVELDVSSPADLISESDLGLSCHLLAHLGPHLTLNWVFSTIFGLMIILPNGEEKSRQVSRSSKALRL